MATKNTETLMQRIEADRAHDLDRLVTLLTDEVTIQSAGSADMPPAKGKEQARHHRQAIYSTFPRLPDGRRGPDVRRRHAVRRDLPRRNDAWSDGTEATDRPQLSDPGRLPVRLLQRQDPLHPVLLGQGFHGQAIGPRRLTAGGKSCDLSRSVPIISPSSGVKSGTKRTTSRPRSPQR
jgi:hypothetical protein